MSPCQTWMGLTSTATDCVCLFAAGRGSFPSTGNTPTLRPIYACLVAVLLPNAVSETAIPRDLATHDAMLALRPSPHARPLNLTSGRQMFRTARETRSPHCLNVQEKLQPDEITYTSVREPSLSRRTEFRPDM